MVPPINNNYYSRYRSYYYQAESNVYGPKDEMQSQRRALHASAASVMSDDGTGILRLHYDPRDPSGRLLAFFAATRLVSTVAAAGSLVGFRLADTDRLYSELALNFAGK
jgi:hypothetical protein